MKGKTKRILVAVVNWRHRPNGLFAFHLGGTNDNDVHSCEQNYMTMQNKIIAKKYYPCINSENCRDSFLQWLGSGFVLDCYILLCDKKISSLAWVALLFVLPGRGANSSQNCCPCLFCSHKQRWLTVLCELWSEVAFNSNTFFLNWKQRTAVKAVEDALLNTSKCMKQEFHPELLRDI